MTRYLLRRAAQAILVLWAAFTVSFVILYLLPSDPIAIMLNPGGTGNYVDPVKAAQLRAEYGFDKPVIVQYLTLLGNYLHGDLGRSIQSGAPVTSAIGHALPQTLQLAGLALALAVVCGVALALLAAYTRSRWLRQSLLSLPPLAVSIPSFWVGLMLLQLFSFHWALFPAVGNEGFPSLVLPAITLALPTAAVIAQVLAKSLSTTWQQPYIETARAKGADRLRIVLHHALRNAIIPTLTMVGLIIGSLLAGTVVVETVFSRNGIGRLTATAVTDQDIPLVQGLVMLSAVIFVVVNLAVDLAYPLVDPRIARTPARQR
jgi:peptide/nickel transport system permease protein